MFTTTWTSPGDDMNEGRVAKYNFYFTSTQKGKNNLQNEEFDNIGLLDLKEITDKEPGEAGTTEQTSMDFSRFSKCPEFALLDIMIVMNVAGSTRKILYCEPENSDEENQFECKGDEKSNLAMWYSQLHHFFNPSEFETQFGFYMAANTTIYEVSELGEFNDKVSANYDELLFQQPEDTWGNYSYPLAMSRELNEKSEVYQRVKNYLGSHQDEGYFDDHPIYKSFRNEKKIYLRKSISR